MESMTTTDNGEIDVHIAPIGEFKGSNSLGNPVPEKITKESLENLAEKLNKGDEISITSLANQVLNAIRAPLVGFISLLLIRLKDSSQS